MFEWVDPTREALQKYLRGRTDFIASLPEQLASFNLSDAMARQPKPFDASREEKMLDNALNFGPAGMFAGASKKAGKEIIKDWKWRPLKDVKEEVGLDKVPAYITDNFGEFMLEQAGKAGAHDLGARDLMKAYGITRSSVNRAGRTVSDDIGKGKFIRPEGYFSEWLLTPQGKAYLDDASRGLVNEEAIADIGTRFAPFGMSNILANDLRWASKNIPPINGRVNDAITGSKTEWREFAQALPGIGPSKSGFIASLLGRGDIPTLDARQIILHTGEPAKGASRFIRRGGGTGGDVAVDRLAARQEKMGLELPERMKQQYQHLTHHAVWDKVGNTQTTHADIIRAMQRGSITPEVAAALLGAGAGGGAVMYQQANGDR